MTRARSMPDIRDQAEPLTPPNEYDTLQIRIRPSGMMAETYQFTLFQRGVPVIGGTSRPTAMITAAEVQSIRSDYEEQVKMFHELDEEGMPTKSPDIDELLDLGRRIAALLPRMAQQSLVVGMQRARRQQRGLRVLLEVTPDARSLLGVPWELIVLPVTRGAGTDIGGEGFLLLNANVALVRQVQSVGNNTRIELRPPLTIQAFAATPDGEHNNPINIMPTRAALEQTFSADMIAQCWYEGTATFAAIHERLHTNSPDILHLLCHGKQTDTGRGTRNDLIFTHRDGLTQRVSAFELAPMLTLAPSVQLVFLEACHSGTTPHDSTLDSVPDNNDEQEQRAIESIALALVRQGIPCVVAMQGEVEQEVAAAFVKSFYQMLQDGHSLEWAMKVGRAAMQAEGGLIDWSLPVVYQGSGQVEPSTWYTRLADRADAAIRDPAATRTLRGALIAWVLILVALGIVRWQLTPASFPDLAALSRPLNVWLWTGIIGPAVIAAAQRGRGGQPDPDKRVKRAAVRAQWIGAYLGSALGGLMGLTLLATLWIAGVFAVLPTALSLTIFSLVLLAALALSYVISRSQWRSALAIAPLNPELYNLPIAWLIIGAMLLLTLLPLSIFVLSRSPLGVLLSPAPGALALALTILALVLSFRE